VGNQTAKILAQKEKDQNQKESSEYWEIRKDKPRYNQQQKPTHERKP